MRGWQESQQPVCLLESEHHLGVRGESQAHAGGLGTACLGLGWQSLHSELFPLAGDLEDYKNPTVPISSCHKHKPVSPLWVGI